MTELDDIIDKIKIHKGVLLPDDQDLGKYSVELYCRACESLGMTYADYKGTVQAFVVNKYKQVLAHCVQSYNTYPDQHAFEYRAQWDDIDQLAERLAERLKNGKKE